MAFEKAADLEELNPGQMKMIPIGTREVLLCNVGGKYYAVDNFCPHMGAPLSEGELDGAELWCPFHGASFDVTNGDVLNPPAYENLIRYSVRVTDEAVEVDVSSS